MVSYVPEFAAKLRSKLEKGGANPEDLPLDAVRTAFNFQMKRPSNARLSVEEFEAFQQGGPGSLQGKNPRNA